MDNRQKFVKRFDEFCADNAIVDYKEPFRTYLENKYPDGVPGNVKLAAEWNLFISDATSKV